MVEDDAVTTAARVRERRLALGWDVATLAVEAVLPLATIAAVEKGDGRSLDVSFVASALGVTLGWVRASPPPAMAASRPPLTPDADDGLRARYLLDQAVEEVALDALELVEAGGPPPGRLGTTGRN